MNFVKQIRVSQKRAKTGFRTEVDHPPFVFNPREVSGIGVAENASAKGDELFMPFVRQGYFGFLHHINPAAEEGGLSIDDYLVG
jgi:hypothetical protein